MKFTLSNQADNAAFHGEDCPEAEHACAEREMEIARILKEVAYAADGGLHAYNDRSASGGISGYIDDLNGNQVGFWALESDD